MKKIFFISFILLFFNSYSQSGSDKLKAISIIESLCYEETMLMGLKIISTYKINYDDNTKKVEIFWKNYYPSMNSSETIKDIFYIGDLDLNTLEENMTKMKESELFSPTIRVKAKGQLIRVEKISEDNKHLLGNSITTEYREFLAIFPGMKSLPKEHAERFLENVKILLLN